VKMGLGEAFGFGLAILISIFLILFLIGMIYQIVRLSKKKDRTSAESEKLFMLVGALSFAIFVFLLWKFVFPD
jgi:4-hydroxybenzoate polyprenyltransferase